MIEQQQKLEIEVLTVGSLKPYARNPRTHSDKQIHQIANSIREFGFTNPVLIFEKLTFAHVNPFPASLPCVVVAQRTPKSRP